MLIDIIMCIIYGNLYAFGVTMTKSTRNIIIIIAAAVLVLAIAAGVWAFLSIKNEEKKIYEYPEYDDKGNIELIAYRDVYGNLVGSENHFKGENNTEYVIHYGKDGEEIGSEVTTVNKQGSPEKLTVRENGEIVSETLYTYYEDGKTLKIKAVKTYEGEDVKAVKEWYDEEGNVTDTKNYLNDEEVN